jgi:hypothetical protein
LRKDAGTRISKRSVLSFIALDRIVRTS